MPIIINQTRGLDTSSANSKLDAVTELLFPYHPFYPPEYVQGTLHIRV